MLGLGLLSRKAERFFEGDDFRSDVRRLPITELGCAAGAMALGRAADFLKAHTGGNVLIIVDSSLRNLLETSTTLAFGWRKILKAKPCLPSTLMYMLLSA